MNTIPIIMIPSSDVSRNGGSDCIMFSSVSPKLLTGEASSCGDAETCKAQDSDCHSHPVEKQGRQSPSSPRSVRGLKAPCTAHPKYEAEDETSTTEEQEEDDETTTTEEQESLSAPLASVPISSQQQQQKPMWSCSCSAENDGRHNFCCMCGEPQFWTCIACDYSDNKCKFKFCGMCGISRTVRKEDLPPYEEEEEEDETNVLRDNEWKCLGCDQINACPYIFCSMCGSSKLEDESAQPVHATFPPLYILVDEQAKTDDTEIHHVSVNSLLFDDSMEWWSDDEQEEEGEHE